MAPAPAESGERFGPIVAWARYTGRVLMADQYRPNAGYSTVPFTDFDIRTLAAKLKGLYALLTPGEQALLDEVLLRASGAVREADAAGFAWEVRFNPLPYLDAIAARW